MVSNGCQCEWLTGPECAEPLYITHKGRGYCVLHYPDSGKVEDFELAVESRLDESSEKYLDFVGVWFPRPISFDNYAFEKRADFSLARFTSDASFNNAHFQDVSFADAHFEAQVDFRGAQISKDADFSRAQFNHGATFSFAVFSRGAVFIGAEFAGCADFSAVEFKEEAYFYSAHFQLALFGPARRPSSVGEPKSVNNVNLIRTKFRNAYFNGATFKSASFHQACFTEILVFEYAEVQDAIDFSVADFNKADFSNSRLTYTNFDGSFFLERPKLNKCELRDITVFSTARLPGIDLSESVVDGHINFTLTRFENVVAEWEAKRLQECGFVDNLKPSSDTIIICFDNVTFKAAVTFKYNELYQERALLSFDDAIFEKPERVRFVSVSLPPHSFMNVDPRKFHFIDTRWGFIDKRTALSDAQKALKKHGRVYSAPVLELAYRQLAVNAEENNRYEQAAELRYLAMEVARSMRWRRIDWLRLSWWYWLLSGYGEKVRRAFAVLLAVWIAFAAIYWLCQDSTWWQIKQTGVTVVSDKAEISNARAKPFTVSEALIYSANVMALQKPEPIPANKRAKLLVLLETIFGPIQAALLALAIRRKFMR